MVEARGGEGVMAEGTGRSTGERVAGERRQRIPCNTFSRAKGAMSHAVPEHLNRTGQSSPQLFRCVWIRLMHLIGVKFRQSFRR